MNRIVEHSYRRHISGRNFARKLPVSPPAWLVEPLLHLTGLAELDRACHRIDASVCKDNPFRLALDCLRIRALVSDDSRARIPETGPTILVANHPFGGADGLALGALALERRKDVRFIANSWLSEVNFLSPWFFPVDVLSVSKNVSHNAVQLRNALRHLQRGGLLIVFPSGTVSQFNPLTGRTEDPVWSANVASLARLSKSTVVPCYFSGSNRPLFHLAGLIHSSLRTALLPSELVSKQNTAINITIGAAIRPNLILRLKTDLERAAWFRLRTYGLEHSESFESAANRKLAPITKPVPSESIAQELSRLPPSAHLLSYGPYRVYFFKHDDAPNTMQEIGRLRELSFRAVDEGTGRASDLDRFDQDYRHLLLWDDSTHSIVGSYRLAFCDEIMKERGPAGLYSNTLFRYKRPMLSILSNSIELGRSFIRPDYQKKPLPLALLWRGIGEVLIRYPKYRQLIGPVTISNRYRGAPGRLLLTYLRQLQESSPLHKQVVARSPILLRQNEFERHFCRTSNVSPKSFSSLLSELDNDGKRIPVLLERYLELGASVLGINRDPSFGNCIDALLVVELEKIPEPLLKRFLGTDGLARCNGGWKLAS